MSPFKMAGGVTLAGLGAALIAGAARARGDADPGPRVWAAWWGLGLIPVVFLPNHTYRYYLTFSTMGAAVLGVQAVRGLLRGAAPRTGAGLLVGWALAAAASSGAYLAARHAEGLAQQDRAGMNGLVARGHTVRLVREGLGRLLPQPPVGAQLVFEGVDVWAFDREAGPRVWSGDPTLQVFSAEFVEREGARLVVRGAPRSQIELYTGGGDEPTPLAPERTFAFALRAGALVRVEPGGLGQRPRPLGIDVPGRGVAQ